MIRAAVLALVVSLFLIGCASTQLHEDGLAAFDAGNYEEAIEMLENALAGDPGNMTYRLDLKSRREQAVQRLIAAGDAARKASEYSEAKTAYQRALQLQSGNERAIRGLEQIRRDQRHDNAIAQAQLEFDQGRLDEAEARLRAVLAEDPLATAAVDLRARIDRAREPVSVTPRLSDQRMVSLQFRDADTKMVFEVLSRQTGINFIFDKDVRTDSKTTIFVQDVTVERAIDLILGQNQFARQVMSENMVLIYPNTPQKQSDYREQIVKTFYLTNVDPKRAADLMRTVLNAKTLFLDERSNSLVIRDTPEAIRMAERLLASIDIPDAEVMMEVEVLEITRTQLQQLGIQWPQQVSLAPTALAGDPLVLQDLVEQDATTITVSSIDATIDLQKEVGVGNLLASPRIRARNDEEAKILIGNRVPVITNTVTPTANGTSVVTGNIEYVDVGLKLAVTPHVYLDNDVSIDVDLEVSNIIREIANESVGTLAYQIGTRNASTLLRLKDGETQILAGLIQDFDRSSSSHVPGLGDMPVLGRLFGSKRDNIENTEIVLSITPHIIRAQPRATSENTEFWYGTQANLYAGQRFRTDNTQLAAGGERNHSAGAVATLSNTSAGDSSSTPSEPARRNPANIRPTLSWEGPAAVALGDEFEVLLNLASEADLSNVRSMVRFDPAVLELMDAQYGSLLRGVSGAPETAAARTGRTVIQPANASVTGEGSLVRLRMKAISARPSTMVSVQQFSAAGSNGRPIPAVAPRPYVLSVSIPDEGP